MSYKKCYIATTTNLKLGLGDMAKNILTILFPTLYYINIYHNIHLPFMGKKMLSTHLLDLETLRMNVNLVVHY